MRTCCTYVCRIMHWMYLHLKLVSRIGCWRLVLNNPNIQSTTLNTVCSGVCCVVYNNRRLVVILWTLNQNTTFTVLLLHSDICTLLKGHLQMCTCSLAAGFQEDISHVNTIIILHLLWSKHLLDQLLYLGQLLLLRWSHTGCSNLYFYYYYVSNLFILTFF